MTLLDLLALTAMPIACPVLSDDVREALLRSRIHPTDEQRAGRAGRRFHGGAGRNRIGRRR